MWWYSTKPAPPCFPRLHLPFKVYSLVDVDRASCAHLGSIYLWYPGHRSPPVSGLHARHEFQLRCPSLLSDQLGGSGETCWKVLFVCRKHAVSLLQNGFMAGLGFFPPLLHRYVYVREERDEQKEGRTPCAHTCTGHHTVLVKSIHPFVWLLLILGMSRTWKMCLHTFFCIHKTVVSLFYFLARTKRKLEH